MMLGGKSFVFQDFLGNELLSDLRKKDFIKWIRTNESELPELKYLNNSVFIPHFLNYISQSCSWMLPKNEKNEFSNAVKLTSSTNKSPENLKEKFTRPVVNNRISVANRIDSIDSDIENCTPFIDTNLKNVGLTMGCAAYNRKVARYGQKKSRRSIITETNVAVKPSPDINNLDAFPPIGTGCADSKTRRRITPTPVPKHSKFVKSEFNVPQNKQQNDAFSISSFVDNHKNLKTERELLKFTRDKFSQQSASNLKPQNSQFNASNIIKSELISSSDSAVTESNKSAMISKTATMQNYAEPNPSSVTESAKLTCAAEILSILFDEMLVPNITSELYFLCELISTKAVECNKLETSAIFSTIHNCIYFATSVLEKQCQLFHMLDNTTLSLMAQIPYLLKFSPRLMDFLQTQCKTKQGIAMTLPSVDRVPFQLDEDNRSNFPDERSFICFKKQRDLFYEMLRNWQQDSAGSTMDTKHGDLTSKARQLINLAPNSVNLFHLAKLFQSQLIASCMCLEVNETYDGLVNEMQKNFPERFKKLSERFLQPSLSGDIAPKPTFYGIQAFFYEIISAAASPAFNQNLQNVLVLKILELNSADVLAEEELESLGTLRDKFVFLLHTLRLLGKFLGYLYFIPYMGNANIPPHIAIYQLEARKCSMTPINVPTLLKEAIAKNRILLTLPWVVEYLSMMDLMALDLEWVSQSMQILMSIYHWDMHCFQDMYARIFLHLLIGWLFDVTQYHTKYDRFLVAPLVKCPDERTKNVDWLVTIDKQLIHSCCPYLIEFKVLAYNFINGIRNKREMRKITPLSTTTSHSFMKLQTENKVQSQLEENFFFLHPTSVKRTTEFVSERMTSKVIGKIRNEVTTLKLQVVEKLAVSEDYKALQATELEFSIRQQKSLELVDKLMHKTFEEVEIKVQDATKNIVKEINVVMLSLLSDDVSKSITDICSKICHRLVVHKVQEWCNSNLLPDAIKGDIKNKVKHLAKCESECEPDKDIDFSRRIAEFRSLVICYHTKNKDDDVKPVQQTFIEMSELIVESSTISVKRTLLFLSIDLYIAFLTNNYPILNKQVNERFVSIWTVCPKSLISISALFCPMNFEQIKRSRTVEISFLMLQDLIKSFLSENIFTIKDLQESLNNLISVEWNDKKFENEIFSLKQFLSSYNNQKK